VHKQPVSSDVANGNVCELSFAVQAIDVAGFLPDMAFHRNEKRRSELRSQISGSVQITARFSTFALSTPLSAVSSFDS
jgi:hypothetical protein